MRKIIYHAQFKKDVKLAMKRGRNIAFLQNVITLLANDEVLPPRYRDHPLTNSRNYVGVRECHIQADWLLVYQYDDDLLILDLLRTGTHSDLF
ncbi:MAG: type II toxin-antitoxin system YafQ family toxin [Deltaproteobacteria bacterium]|nr:type II toxin-antitoxin system YafQ family toxin [Deltaproteobacteria bacterium]MBR5705319.1 type II toxin-antitoxin system YafQ family toxin [Deltaproteobacteria bacterium]